MDAATPRQVEIFAPFEEAFALMRAILFRPFDLGKWCVIGFAAFLAHLGGGGSFRFPSNFGKADANFRSTTQGMASLDALPGWVIPVVIAFLLIICVLVVVLTWVRARGEFIFTDCIVQNRGAIVEPWKEFRQQGNSLFLLRFLVGLSLLVLVTVLSLPFWWPLLWHHTAPSGVPLIVGIVLVVCVLLMVGIAWGMISYFMVPIMYRRRCTALLAVREGVALILAQPGPIILFFLFNIVLAVAFVFTACLLTCVTCCVAAIPYVGTVILLPAYVFWNSYLLLFVRQFGGEYDVWAGLTPGAANLPPIQAPPDSPMSPLA
ncbi:MAG: hypothetical protein ABI992_01885 [Chthoniobacterales bacterium]